LVTAGVGDCDTKSDTFMDSCNARVNDAASRLDSAKSNELVGFIGIGVGVAVIATGVAVLLTGESSHRFDAPARSADSRPGSWALLPGPGQCGLALGHAF